LFITEEIVSKGENQAHTDNPNDYKVVVDATREKQSKGMNVTSKYHHERVFENDIVVIIHPSTRICMPTFASGYLFSFRNLLP